MAIDKEATVTPSVGNPFTIRFSSDGTIDHNEYVEIGRAIRRKVKDDDSYQLTRRDPIKINGGPELKAAQVIIGPFWEEQTGRRPVAKPSAPKFEEKPTPQKRAASAVGIAKKVKRENAKEVSGSKASGTASSGAADDTDTPKVETRKLKETKKVTGTYWTRDLSGAHKKTMDVTIRQTGKWQKSEAKRVAKDFLKESWKTWTDEDGKTHDEGWKKHGSKLFRDGGNGARRGDYKALREFLGDYSNTPIQVPDKDPVMLDDLVNFAFQGKESPEAISRTEAKELVGEIRGKKGDDDDISVGGDSDDSDVDVDEAEDGEGKTSGSTKEDKATENLALDDESDGGSFSGLGNLGFNALSSLSSFTKDPSEQKLEGLFWALILALLLGSSPEMVEMAMQVLGQMFQNSGTRLKGVLISQMERARKLMDKIDAKIATLNKATNDRVYSRNQAKVRRLSNRRDRLANYVQMLQGIMQTTTSNVENIFQTAQTNMRQGNQFRNRMSS